MQAQISAEIIKNNAAPLPLWEQINRDVIELHANDAWQNTVAEALKVSKAEFADKREQLKKIFDHGLNY
jgi:hypothetical protein